ncbi:hypothetical protein DFH94DRAFT_166224 [Russula ochroleuca]|uniref:Uncharacterized protein n=1 Tax=Russula ochroleuca TaxID=152965 RepID=A0A9P5N4E3_9AGAM|nr:hypothetical protein DFH94DRAFT_166224 [Russula ochroleuca]
MKYFSIGELKVPGKVLDLDADDLRRNYETWGPSARTCVRLLRDPTREYKHESDVMMDAIRFVANPNAYKVALDAIKVIQTLFSIRPEDESPKGRAILIAEIASNRIKEISYAAADADAQERVYFYQTMSKRRAFKVAAGQVFERLVVSWLASPNEGSLHCTSAGSRYCRREPEPPDLRILAYEEEQTSFFGSLTALEKAKMDEFPLCLLPTSKTFTTIDAIILTTRLIITVQVTTSHELSASAQKAGFVEVNKSIPRDIIKQCKWCHVFITDDHVKAESLRDQTNQDFFRDLRNGIFFYSAVFDVGWPDIFRAHLVAFDEKKRREREQRERENSMDVDNG